ncbi:CUE domain-containing protein 1 isoform X1 [Biomphalaria pfeifferi]|uniref:CUE domain-containing protein 1 isoform X1 n=1 Tax=Biomphalaria pfeifferi TaxID=112525 RepID=A0AAD8F1Z6_BIOPF|nr:CUE domain-containing protein 1 isoform X1 [Biomphalaria pfeifferi]
MTETDNISRLRSVSQGEDSPGRPPGRPMRQLEFHQAMSDFRHMFPETDEEVIEAVLRANNGMVDATIDQLLTMNIDADLNEDDDLSDHILMSVERDVQQSQHVQPVQGLKRSGRETKHNKKGVPELQDKPSKDSEDCPPSYTEAVQSHMAHNYKSSSGRNRHRNSPTMAVNNGSGHHSRHTIGTMQHLLDLGPDTAPVVSSTSGPGTKTHHSHHHSIHHHHHHVPRSSNHHRRRGETLDGSPHKPRPGRNILSTSTVPSHVQQDMLPDDFSFRPHRKGSLDSNDFVLDGGPGMVREKSPHRWRSGHRDSTTTVKRPAYRNWNPPMLGTLPDDFLRLIPGPTQPPRPLQPGTQLHRTLSAVGPQRPSFYPVPAPSPLTSAEANNSSMGQVVKQKASQKPHRSLSFAGHTNQARRPQTAHPSGLAQHEFSSDILQERMKENERRRHLTSMDVDPDMAQYLEDERLAIMLQNSEFLQELRGDRIFMMTLERDLRNSEKTKVEQPAEPSTPPSLDPENQDFIEGYGDDRRDTLEAFPFSQQLPPPVSEDVELRKKLKNMGKASRKQFAALARRFFLKWKKRSPQQILKESQAPSMMNLLDEDDDVEEEDQMFNVENNPTMESSCPTTHSHQSTSTSGTWHSPHQRHFDIV